MTYDNFSIFDDEEEEEEEKLLEEYRQRFSLAQEDPELQAPEEFEAPVEFEEEPEDKLEEYLSEEEEEELLLESYKKRFIAAPIQEEPVDQPSGLTGAIGVGFQRTAASMQSAGAVVANEEEWLESAAKTFEEAGDTPEQIAFKQALHERGLDDPEVEDGVWGLAKEATEAVKDIFGAAIAEPTGFLHESLAQLPNSGVIVGSAFAGSRIGGAIGAMTGTPIGVGVGAMLGAIAGLFLGNIAIETGFAGIDQEMEGEEFDRGEILETGIKKGGVISLVDVATMGINKWMFGAPGKAAKKVMHKMLKANNINPLDDAAVQAAMKLNPALEVRIRKAATAAAAKVTPSKAGIYGRNVLAFGLESTGETVGEYGGSVAAGLDASMTDAVLEGMMSGPTSVAHIAISKSLAKTKDITGKQKEKKLQQEEEQFKKDTEALVNEFQEEEDRREEVKTINFKGQDIDVTGVKDEKIKEIKAWLESGEIKPEDVKGIVDVLKTVTIKPESTEPTTKPLTPEHLKSISDTITTLNEATEDKVGLDVYETQAELPEHILKTIEEGGVVEGGVDPKTGNVFFIAENLKIT